MTRGLRALVWKDLLRQVKDVKGLLIYLAVPLVLTFIMGVSFGGGVFGRSGISAIPLALSGGDLDAGLQDRFAEALRQTELFTVTWTDTTTAKDLVRHGDVRAALLLPDHLVDRFFGGEDVVLELWKDPNSQVGAGVVESILTGLLSQFQASEAAYRALWPEDDPEVLADDDGPLADLFSGDPVRMIQVLRADDGTVRREMLDHLERSAVFAEAMREPTMPLALHDRQDWEAASGDARTSRSLYDYYLPSFAVFFMMFGTAAVVRDLHRERASKTLARLLCGPTNVMAVVLGKWVTAMVMSSAQLVVLLLAGGLLFGVRVFEAPVALAMVAVAASGAAASVYLVISLIASSEKVMDAITTVFTLICGMLGGNFFPVDLMPAGLVLFGRATFNYWANKGFSDIIAHGKGLVAVIPEVSVLVVIAALGLTVSMAIFSLRQRQGVAA
jgi:ABC-2 type transport system permease protein